jgi:hypothetical protein
METNTYIYIIGKFVHFFTKISKFSFHKKAIAIKPVMFRDIPYFDLASHDLSEVGPLDFPFNCAEVRKGILKLKNNKQPGIDLVPNAKILCSLFCNRDVKSLPKQLVRPRHL